MAESESLRRFSGRSSENLVPGAHSHLNLVFLNTGKFPEEDGWWPCTPEENALMDEVIKRHKKKQEGDE